MGKSTQIELLSEKQRQWAIERIIDYFATQRDEQIGRIAAEELLDAFVDMIGGDIFNQGVKETKRVVNNKLQSLDFDIDLLIKE